MNSAKKTHIIYSIFLLLVTIIIWRLIYFAQFLEYDNNYASLLLAFFISLVSFAILIVLWFKWKHIIKTCNWQTIIFLIVSSPVTVALVSINYSVIFGTMLKS